MHVLARFDGPNGEIRVLEDPATGARLYEEGGVSQSRVLAGGEADVAYVRLMAALLAGGADALCCSAAAAGRWPPCCTGEAAASPSSRSTRSAFSWRGRSSGCRAASNASRPTCANSFARRGAPSMPSASMSAVRSFSYEEVLSPATIARVRRALRDGGRVAVNISLEAPDDPVPGRIADRLAAEGLEVWAFAEPPTLRRAQHRAPGVGPPGGAIRARRDRRRELVACPADGAAEEQPARRQGAPAGG